MSAPKVRFMTKIYHPNIDKLGRICLDILKGEMTSLVPFEPDRSFVIELLSCLASWHSRTLGGW